MGVQGKAGECWWECKERQGNGGGVQGKVVKWWWECKERQGVLVCSEMRSPGRRPDSCCCWRSAEAGRRSTWVGCGQTGAGSHAGWWCGHAACGSPATRHLVAGQTGFNRRADGVPTRLGIASKSASRQGCRKGLLVGAQGTAEKWEWECKERLQLRAGHGAVTAVRWVRRGGRCRALSGGISADSALGCVGLWGVWRGGRVRPYVFIAGMKQHPCASQLAGVGPVGGLGQRARPAIRRREGVEQL